MAVLVSQVSQVMTRPPVLIGASDSSDLAEEVCRLHDVHFLIVVTGGEPCGVTCRCDLRWAFPGLSVASVMQRAIATVRVEQSSRDAVDVMAQSGVGCLIVIDALGHAVGVLTRRDLISHGVLVGERGIDCCAACGDIHHVLPVDCPGAPAFCGNCLEQVRTSGPRDMYFTLGGGD
jgi:CBS domain-containing protein